MDHLLAAVGNGALSCTFAVGTARTAVYASTAATSRSLVQLAKCGTWGEHLGNTDSRRKCLDFPAFCIPGASPNKPWSRQAGPLRLARQVQFRNCSRVPPQNDQRSKNHWPASYLCLVGDEVRACRALKPHSPTPISTATRPRFGPSKR